MQRCTPSRTHWDPPIEAKDPPIRPSSDLARGAFYRRLLHNLQNPERYETQSREESYDQLPLVRQRSNTPPAPLKSGSGEFQAPGATRRQSKKNKSGALYGVHERQYQHETPQHDPGRTNGPADVDSRRRDPRVSGSDLYVVRVKKSGLGDAMPCWRCLEWCRWAGVKRVFHWNSTSEGEGTGRWEVVKVNDSTMKLYQTRSDFNLVSAVCTLWAVLPS